MITCTIEAVVARLEAWLQTMRGPRGYGGPVAHWWQQSLLYTGPGLDWRYEGIITGYLHLWERTGNEKWLAKARRAGDDLMAGQLPNGHFAASAFEINPATAGTPHEAACDVGLLRLAQALRQAAAPDWHQYAACAERNLQRFYVDILWDEEVQAFRDTPHAPSFVPNKAATACEAFFLLAEVQGDERWVERYVRPTLHCLLAHQVRAQGPLHGAIAQNSFGARRIEKYFPIYIARCVPALLQGYAWTSDERLAEAALQALRFVQRWQQDDGTLPTVVYSNRQTNCHPCWIAPLGDVLRAAALLHPFGFDADLSALHERLIAGQDSSGGIQTASGFAAQAGGRLPNLPDVRDRLHVVGWCDKAFRYLAQMVQTDLPDVDEPLDYQAPCIFRGSRVLFHETHEKLSIRQGTDLSYHWRKGADWPEVAAPAFWLR